MGVDFTTIMHENKDKVTNLDFIKDVNSSIVVLATPRTGSTALCLTLSEKCNLIYCNEAFNSINLKTSLFLNYFEKNKKTIVKIFPNHQDNLTQSQFNSIIEKSFVIFLDRRNVAEQIVSYHILAKTKKASYNTSETLTEYSVEETDIAKSVSSILKLREEAEKYRKLANVTLTYEDIIDHIVNPYITKYHKPTNYNSLKLKVDNTLSKFLSLKEKINGNE